MQIDSASDGLSTGVYIMKLDGNGMATSAEECGLPIPNIGDNVTVYGTWARSQGQSSLVIPTNITINS